MFVAETDFPLAAPIHDALAEAVANGDTGYTPPDPGLRTAFVSFAKRHFGWDVDPAGIRSTGDVMMGVVEILRAVIEPGDRVVISTPVYPPFGMIIPEADGVIEDVPLIDTGTTWELDLDGIDAALADGARAVLLCNPQNPTGTVHSRESLAGLAEIARRHGVPVVSDEIHSPLVYPGATFTPFLDASPDAVEVGFAVTSASKAFNLAGLKCALMVASGDGPKKVLRELSPEVEWRTSLFGAIAGVAAFSDDSAPWLESLVARLDLNRVLLADLLDEHLPLARYRIPEAGYLAWIDVSAYGWGDDPARAILRGAQVALHHGPLFGPQGVGHVRVNFGCAPEVLREAVARIAALTAS